MNHLIDKFDKLYILFSYFVSPPSSFRTYQFLSQFNDVASHNNFFDPGFQPEDMNSIPGLYSTIIDDPAALHDKFKEAEGR